MKKIDLKLIQAVVLLDRQYALLEHLISTQAKALQDFEEAINRGQQSLTHVLDVYNYAFALIDHLDRYRKIALCLPKFNQKSPEYRALIGSMGNLQDARNQIQHINNDIENDYTGPLLGSIFWVNGSKQFVSAFNDIGRERSANCAIFDTQKCEYIHKFCYVYNEQYYDLDKAIEGAKVFNSYINTNIKIQIDGKDYDINKHFAAFCIEFKIESVSEAAN